MPMPIKLWLDDLREPPEGWIWVKTVELAKWHFKTDIPILAISLDNDLGENEPEGRKLVLWLSEVGMENPDIWPDEVFIHSANPVAHDYMVKMIERYKP